MVQTEQLHQEQVDHMLQGEEEAVSQQKQVTRVAFLETTYSPSMSTISKWLWVNLLFQNLPVNSSWKWLCWLALYPRTSLLHIKTKTAQLTIDFRSHWFLNYFSQNGIFLEKPGAFHYWLAKETLHELTFMAVCQGIHSWNHNRHYYRFPTMTGKLLPMRVALISS